MFFQYFFSETKGEKIEKSAKKSGAGMCLELCLKNTECQPECVYKKSIYEID